MAKSKNNLITQGVTGKLANLIFRTRGNKQFLYTYTPRTVPDSAAQKLVKNRFKLAIQFAKEALVNPLIKQQYLAIAKQGQTAHNVAISDFLNPPVIEKVNITRYKGKLGNSIDIWANDKGIITKIEVIITGFNNIIIEKGEAAATKTTGKWLYTATQNNRALSTTTITIKVHDYAGNITQNDIQL